MAGDNDYRNTSYCPVLDRVEEQKKLLEKEIKSAFPRIKIIYNKVSDRSSIYHKKFAAIYNDKCAYCGAMWGLLPTESFEVDHFLNEDSFPKTTEGRAEAGRMVNLVWAYISCNRGKRGITIMPPYDELLNVDNGNITKVFKRDEMYSIQIRSTYQDDKFVRQFYDALHLGYEARRLDYLALQIEGKYQAEKDEKRKCKLGESLSILLKKRNRMTITGGMQ